MTNDELKKKIKEILRKRMTELLGSCHTDEIPLTEEGAEAILFYADEFADALIAAGLTFDKTTAILAERTNSKTLIHKAQYYDEIKHRAEVAERALMTVCANVIKDEEDDLAIEPRARVLYKAYLKQAEKELAEEGKDERP